MIIIKRYGSFINCDIEPMPNTRASLANVSSYVEKERVKVLNGLYDKAMVSWEHNFTICKKLLTLPEHQDYFAQFEEGEIMAERVDYHIARIPTGGRSVKDGAGTQYEYVTYLTEYAVPITVDVKEIEKTPLFINATVTTYSNGTH